MREAAVRLNRHRDVLPLAPFDDPAPDVRGVLGAFEEALANFAQVEDKVKDLTNKTYTEFHRMREVYAELRALGPEGIGSAVTLSLRWTGETEEIFGWIKRGAGMRQIRHRASGASLGVPPGLPPPATSSDCQPYYAPSLKRGRTRHCLRQPQAKDLQA